MNTPYLSVEIVIETQSTADALVAAFLPGKIKSGFFAPHGEVLGDDSCDTTITRLRLEDPDRTKLIVSPITSNTHNADDQIRELCTELNLFSVVAMREWDEADLREFYVGYDVDSIDHSYINRFSQDTIRAAADLHAAIGIVMYAGRND
jgi:hypothetical protein